MSEDYTHRELANKFKIKFDTLRKKIYQESWHKLRKAYLSRVNQINIGQELGLYTQENYQAEIAALNACYKLGKVLDTYIETKFGSILELNEDIHDDGEVDDDIRAQMEEVNRNTGVPIFIDELRRAVDVSTRIYDLSRKIYDNAPKTEVEIIENMANKPKFANEREREAKIKQLEARIGRKLAEIESKKEVVTVDITDVE